MSAQSVTSEKVPFEVDGKEEIFRTVTTHENEKIVKEVYQIKIDKKTYDERIKGFPDLLTKEGENYYMDVNKYGDEQKLKFTPYASDPVKKLLNKKGKGSLNLSLVNASLAALKKQTGKTKVWVEQLNKDNIANDPITSFKAFNIELPTITAKRRTVYQTLKYPEDLAESKQDRIVFSMFYTSSRNINVDLSNINNGSSPLTFGQRETTPIIGSVTLPIQGNVQDTNTVEYGSSNLNPLQAAGFALAYDPITGIRGIGQLLDTPANELQAALRSETGQNLVNALKTVLASQSVGGGVFTRATGAILNPNVELLFRAPQLRTFNFFFRMSARSRTEASQIKKIIRFFKQGMSVKKSGSNIFVVTPNQFRIRYLTGEGRDHPSIGRIKECALVSLNTQYAPDGTYMTYDDLDRTMTSYQIGMRFTEIVPITEDDYLGVTNTSSGPLADSDEAFTRDDAIPLDHIGF